MLAPQLLNLVLPGGAEHGLNWAARGYVEIGVNVDPNAMPKTKHACDKDLECQEIALNMVHPPEHLHQDLNDRITLEADRQLNEIRVRYEKGWDETEEKNAKLRAAGFEPEESEWTGEALLREYMQVLENPKSWRSTAPCLTLTADSRTWLAIWVFKIKVR